jgi:hypothetical protein
MESSVCVRTLRRLHKNEPQGLCVADTTDVDTLSAGADGELGVGADALQRGRW